MAAETFPEALYKGSKVPKGSKICSNHSISNGFWDYQYFLFPPKLRLWQEFRKQKFSEALYPGSIAHKGSKIWLKSLSL